jgi:hypothetical protein
MLAYFESNINNRHVADVAHCPAELNANFAGDGSASTHVRALSMTAKHSCIITTPYPQQPTVYDLKVRLREL